MNRLREKRVECNLSQPQLADELWTPENHLDVGMISRFENGVCLPTPKVMLGIEDALHTSRYALYDVEDIDLLHDGSPAAACKPHKAVTPPKEDSNPDFRKCYRIPREMASELPDDLLAVCGYKTWNDWHLKCYGQLLSEYNLRKKETK